MSALSGTAMLTALVGGAATVGCVSWAGCGATGCITAGAGMLKLKFGIVGIGIVGIIGGGAGIGIGIGGGG